MIFLFYKRALFVYQPAMNQNPRTKSQIKHKWKIQGNGVKGFFLLSIFYLFGSWYLPFVYLLRKNIKV